MHLHRRHLLAGTVALALPALAGAADGTPAATSDTSATSATSAAAVALHALFARYWEETARRFPEWASFRGDTRYGDRLDDVSPSAQDANRAQLLSWVAEARAVPAAELDATDRVSREMFIHELESYGRLAAVEGWTSMRLGALRGAQTLLADLLRLQPVDTPAQVEQLLARLAAFPARMVQEQAWLERGLALGWVAARPVLERVLRQIDDQLAPPLREGPFFEPLRRLPPAWSAAQRAAAQDRAEAAIASQVLPAMRQLRRFVAERCLPRAPADGSLAQYPGGAAVYAELVRQSTTLERSPQDLHDTGLAELQRLHGEFRQVMAAMGLNGSFAEAVAQLDRPGEDRFFPSPEAMLDGYRAMAKRLDAETPRLFAELPRLPFGVRAMPAHLGAGAADTYSRPPADGSAPGWFNANVLAYARRPRRPRRALPTLVAHETVPGHHLQVARAMELTGLPAFRRQGFYVAYGEGWALYAERLMDEQGFYATPAERFGFLQAQAFRAARLVVDTGLHALGWSRQRALDFMVAQCGEAESFMSAEVDRYLSAPGQALAYMTGQLHILALRERARRQLGERFDLRRFHNAVIDQGAVPLPVLSGLIDDWIARQPR